MIVPEEMSVDATVWLTGTPMDPTAEPIEPLPPLPGIPFVHPGASVIIAGPTGGGRSFLLQAAFYDAALLGVRCAYFGSEIPEGEFNARAAVIADRRGEEITDELREQLARVRYLSLSSTLAAASIDPTGWVKGITALYDVIGLDPLSAVASALDLDFDRSNAEFVRFFDTYIQPLTSNGVAVLMPDNIGHAIESKNRAKGASAKSDKADLTFTCSKSEAGLIITAKKVRSIRAGITEGDSWLFERDTFAIRPHTASTEPATSGFRPTHLMERVCRLVHEQPGIGKKALRENGGSKATHIDSAVEALIAEGFIDRKIDESNNAHRHYPLKPFSEAQDDVSDEGRVPACPRFVPDTVSGVSPVSKGVSGRVPTTQEGCVPCPKSSSSDTDTLQDTSKHAEIDPDAEIDYLIAKHGADPEFRY